MRWKSLLLYRFRYNDPLELLRRIRIKEHEVSWQKRGKTLEFEDKRKKNGQRGFFRSKGQAVFVLRHLRCHGVYLKLLKEPTAAVALPLPVVVVLVVEVAHLKMGDVVDDDKNDKGERKRVGRKGESLTLFV